MRDVPAILARMARMKDKRGSTNSYWQQVADYMLPAREFTRASSPGSRRTASLIFNTSPILALEQLAGALHGMLTSPSLRWFALRPSDDGLLADTAVGAWFEACTDAMYGVFTDPNNGFDTACHEIYLDLCGFGTACLHIPDRGRKGPRYEALPISSCYFAVGEGGMITTVYRNYEESLSEICRMWPNSVPDTIRQKAALRPDEKAWIVHAVEPAADGQTWESAYILQREKTLLEEATYKTFCFVPARWAKRSGEIDGFGPAMSALPDVKMLNKLDELTLRAAEKTVDPAIMLPDDGFLDTPTTRPGGINYFRSGSPMLDKIGPLVTGAKPEIGEKLIEMIEGRIRRMFYVDWLNLPQQPNMTATEVLQRRDEMLRLLGPMVARVTAEYLARLIDRTFHVMAANEMLPPAPASLAGSGYKVAYLGPLAIAQRASDAESVTRWLAAIAQLAQVDPDVAMIIDTEAAARFLASRYGAPATIVRSPQLVAQLRQANAEKAQQEHEMAAVQAAGGAAKDGTGALAQLMQALGQGQGGQPGAPQQPQQAA